MPARLRYCCVLLVGLIALVAARSASAVDFMFQTRIDGELLEGKPLTWNAVEVVLLGRDGRMHFFDPRKAKDSKKTDMRFHGYSMSEMRSKLHREFGKDYDVTATNHYIVVHPRGQKDRWAQRFEELYRSFYRYFRVRGFQLQEPEYPLVAVVFRNQDQYLKATSDSPKSKEGTTLGHYDPKSNRIFLFDVTDGDSDKSWARNAETIVHEATHQSAFNTNIHTRMSFVPRWVVEGLATMFEARGVWDSQYNSSDADRINYEQLQAFQQIRGNWKDGSLLSFIASDQKFKTDMFEAYAMAWALSFYLCESQPRAYADYLAKMAERPMFTEYPDAERVADFQEFFGDNPKIFEKKFLRWMDELTTAQGS